VSAPKSRKVRSLAQSGLTKAEIARRVRTSPQNVHAALNASERRGRPAVIANKSKRLLIRVTPDQHERLKRAANAKGVSMADFVAQWLETL
jgi:predicted HicB family RNase H-like nuclease